MWSGISATQTSVSHAIAPRYFSSSLRLRRAVTNTSPALLPAKKRGQAKKRGKGKRKGKGVKSAFSFQGSRMRRISSSVISRPRSCSTEGSKRSSRVRGALESFKPPTPGPGNVIVSKRWLLVCSIAQSRNIAGTRFDLQPWSRARSNQAATHNK